MSDVDVMRKAIVDARQLVFSPKKGEHLSYSWSVQYGDCQWNSWSSSERAVADIARSFYDSRMRLIASRQHGDWLADSNQLETEFSQTLVEMAEQRAWALVERELGEEAFAAFRNHGIVTVEAKNGHSYTITKDGRISIIVKGKTLGFTTTRQLHGSLAPDSYNFADALATLIKWLKTEPDIVDRTIERHCGKVHVKGGEITV